MHDSDKRRLQAYANKTIKKYQVPGVSLAMWKDGQLHKAAAGILNLNTGVEATTDSIFQIGSITKVFTAALVMQLVDEGYVDLDVPIQRYLPDFYIADANASKTITVRQLLNHTNGIAGDFFPNDSNATGNLVARYIDRCNQLPLVHPVGEFYSYSNAAYVVAGRLVEVIRGISWHQAMQDYIFNPLGMNHAISDPKDTIRYRTAMGHIWEGDNTDHWVLPEQAYLTLGAAPVGTTPTMSAANLITFARAFLEGGLSQFSKPWLSARALSAMQTPYIELPRSSQVCQKYAGLGWSITDYASNKLRVIEHAGGTNGQLAMLQVAPAQNSAFAILLNGFSPKALSGVNQDLLQDVMGVDSQEPEFTSMLTPLEHLQRYCGRYQSLDTCIDVVLNDQKLFAEIEYLVDPLPKSILQLKPIDEKLFATFSEEGVRTKGNIAFTNQDKNGVPQYLFRGQRLNARVCDLKC